MSTRPAPSWTRPRVLWNRLTGSLWFVPGIMLLAAVVTAVLMVELSTRVDREALIRFPRLFGASAQSSREMLSTIAGAMMTVAGVTFSITVLAVAQASSQYTPRILRNFMRDRPNQITLGSLTGVFVYCLVVMRTIRGAEELLFIPALAVLLAVVLAIGAIAVLIYFIHHIAESLEASHILARVLRDTIATIDRECPPAAPTEYPAVEPPRDGWRPVSALATGYITHFDLHGLLQWRSASHGFLRMERGVGDYVVEGTPLVSVVSTGTITEDDRRTLNAFYEIGPNRTIDQDPVFGLRQMVDIAVKALSPGVNDTTTAIASIDAIGAALHHLAGRDEQPALRRAAGGAGVVLRPLRFESAVSVGVDEIRRCAGGNVNVLARLLGMLATVAAGTSRRDHHAILRDHGRRLLDVAERSVPDALDRRQVDDAYRDLLPVTGA